LDQTKPPRITIQNQTMKAVGVTEDEAAGQPVASTMLRAAIPLEKHTVPRPSSIRLVLRPQAADTVPSAPAIGIAMEKSVDACSVSRLCRAGARRRAPARDRVVVDNLSAYEWSAFTGSY
jgi:hypothetical protein